jgi:hypothetical protein
VAHHLRAIATQSDIFLFASFQTTCIYIAESGNIMLRSYLEPTSVRPEKTLLGTFASREGFL